MLILTRKVGETIRINDDISVTVLGVNGMQARLGINAPKEVIVDREEIAIRRASGVPRPDAKTVAPEPLYGNRTETEWRQLLAEEQTEREAQGQEKANDAA